MNIHASLIFFLKKKSENGSLTPKHCIITLITILLCDLSAYKFIFCKKKMMVFLEENHFKKSFSPTIQDTAITPRFSL